MTPVIVLTTVGTTFDVQPLALQLVEQGVAACVNVIPQIQSVYRWKGKIERDTEHLLLVKTTAERFDAVRSHIRSIHTYALPEIIAIPVETGDAEALDWIRSSVESTESP